MNKYTPFKPRARAFPICFLMAFFSINASASETACPSHFLDGKAPSFTHESFEKHTQMLCFTDFATLNSKTAKTPLYAAEHLKKSETMDAKSIERYNVFYEESRLPWEYRAALNDYLRSGYDRGHLAPAGNMSNEFSMRESFSLANIIPQDPKNNRGIWSSIESNVRKISLKHNEVYIVTGVAYMSHAPRVLNARVLIPDVLYKAVYIPKKNTAAVYWSPNDSSSSYEIISLEELKLRAGVSVFAKQSIQYEPSLMEWQIKSRR